MKEQKHKTAWDDLSITWKKVAATITAIGIISTFIVQVFHTPSDVTYAIAAGIGVVLLIISWYSDKQAMYVREELEQHKLEADNVVSNINNSLQELKALSLDTRKDTLRIQLLMYINSDAANTDTILKIAETYFVSLGGDWYMTSEFTKWAKKHDVQIPTEIFNALQGMHKGD